MLRDPRRARCVGELRWVRSSQGVSLRYRPDWLDHGFALSEDLPLIDQEFLPAEPHAAAGALADAHPEDWGERVIRLLDRPQRLSRLDLLYLAGDDRFGALGVSSSAARYLPRRLGPLPPLEHTAAVYEGICRLRDGAPLSAQHAAWVASGSGFGGSSPKTLAQGRGETWLVKFAAEAGADAPLIEHATLRLARKAEIRSAETEIVPLRAAHALAVRRFDRDGGTRLHCLSGAVALRAAGEAPGYPELAQLLRRRGDGAGERYVADMRELFRRMVYNILMDNTDDHAGNHALIVTGGRHYGLAPAFDVSPAGFGLGVQRMRVGEQGEDATMDNALSDSSLFALTRDGAAREARAVARVVSGWQEHFRACGVTSGEIERCAQQIDRPFLREQRQEISGMRAPTRSASRHRSP